MLINLILYRFSSIKFIFRKYYCILVITERKSTTDVLLYIIIFNSNVTSRDPLSKKRMINNKFANDRVSSLQLCSWKCFDETFSTYSNKRDKITILER